MPFTRPRYCSTCGTRLISMRSQYQEPVSTCRQCREREAIPWNERQTDLCLSCKQIRPVSDFLIDRLNQRTATCLLCHNRKQDYYREKKGLPLSAEGRARQFKRAQRVVDRALRNRLRLEKQKTRWHKGFYGSPTWNRGPYRQWEGYTEPREEGYTDLDPQEGQEDPQEGQEDPLEPQTRWEGPQESQEDPLSLQTRWEDTEESQEDPQKSREDPLSPQTRWEDTEESQEDPQESREDTTESSEEPQTQFCSACNQKKLLIDFGDGFFTCNKCRERNKRSNKARQDRIRIKLGIR
ncbi:hypothetical protein BKA61DRAFT_583282 [Leptodontidium sp. MPI-SDFR-AT-0119]|nr:hypothetical protein BKA61DRAFT_583282 [Leptodontidium sp. MPI-SDFR-AT-0119]